MKSNCIFQQSPPCSSLHPFLRPFLLPPPLRREARPGEAGQPQEPRHRPRAVAAHQLDDVRPPERRRKRRRASGKGSVNNTFIDNRCVVNCATKKTVLLICDQVSTTFSVFRVPLYQACGPFSCVGSRRLEMRNTAFDFSPCLPSAHGLALQLRGEKSFFVNFFSFLKQCLFKSVYDALQCARSRTCAGESIFYFEKPSICFRLLTFCKIGEAISYVRTNNFFPHYPHVGHGMFVSSEYVGVNGFRPKKTEMGKSKVVDPPGPPQPSIGVLGGVVGRRRFLSPFRRLCPTWVLARKPEGRKEGSVSPLIFTPIVSRPSLLFRPI